MLQESIRTFKVLQENTSIRKAEKAAERLAKQLNWPDNPPYWMNSIGAAMDSRRNGIVYVGVIPGYHIPELPKHIDGVAVVAQYNKVKLAN